MAATAREDFTHQQQGGRWVAGAALLCAAAMLAWMGRSLLTGQIPFTGDLLHFHYPLRDFYARALAAGQPFDWMPSLFNGFYLVGEGQLGGYHPVHWLLYRLLPLDRAFAIELVLAYPVLFAGAWLWLRRYAGTAPAAFGAMVMTFSGFTLTHGVHPNIVGVMAHLPWLLLALDAAAPSGRPRRRGTGQRAVAVIALLTGSQLLMGHPQSVWFSVLIEAAYVVYLTTTDDSAGRWGRLGSWLTGLALGSLVGAVQLLATFDGWRHSTRPAFDAAYATAFSLRPLQLLQLLHPFFFWGRVSRWNEAPGAGDEFGVYGGGVALLLALWWLAQSMGRSRDGSAAGEAASTREPRSSPGPGHRFGWCVAAFGVLGLWLATGSYGRLYLFQTWLPIISSFRAPVRYVLFAQWALAVLASLAVARLLRGPSGSRAGRCALFATVTVAAATAWLVPFTPAASPPEVLVARWLGPAVLATSALLVMWAARGARLPLVALVLLAAGDQALYGLHGVVAWQDFITRQQAIGYLDTNSFLRAPPAGRLARGGFPNLYLLAGYRVVDGYVALEPARQLDYRVPEALRLAQAEFANEDLFKGTRAPEGQRLDRGWIVLPPPVPRVRLVAEARVSSTPRADLAGLDIDRVALVTHDLTLSSGSGGTTRITRDAPGDIAVETNAAAPRLLVVSESFDEGWMVDVDGAPGAVERVNGDFLGAVVPAGSHTATFRFQPRHLLVGKWLSALGLLLAFVLMVRPRLRAPGSRLREESGGD